MSQAVAVRTTSTINRTSTSTSTTGNASDLDTYLGGRLQRMAELPQGDPTRNTLRDEVICACLPVVRRLAARFFGRGETPEDLVQVATIGLIKSVDRYDPTRETQFLSYATPTILGEIKRHFRDKGWSVRVSRPMQELYLSISRILPDMAQELGRSPRVSDLAERLGVSEEDIVRGIDCGQAYSARSLSAPVGGDDGGAVLSDLLGDVDERMESVADRQTLRQLLTEVPERERNILALRFFANLTQSEIAERVGVSQMHVSRLLTRTLSDLRERLLAED
ncbi:MAG TPA: SigB/SigF/SigG family RNA polymerase sigma factor [Micromonosporaceae bacterium]|jgi:RNA polymerase sigma-B factor